MVVVDLVYDGCDFDGFDRVKEKDGDSTVQAATFTLFNSDTDRYVEIRLPMFDRRALAALGPHIDTASDGYSNVKLTVKIEITRGDEDE